MEEYQLATLENGLRVVGVPMPSFRSASVGLWIDSGSLYETPEENGISHFIEHMLFKGTYRRSARQIAEEMDAVGGMLNAFTDVETTCFHTRVITQHLPLAMDMIADLVLNSRLDPDDIRREKGVVLEEISMAEDTPDDLVFEQLLQAHYGPQPVSQPVLGSADNVNRFTREDIVKYMSGHYHPDGAVLALAGAYDWDAFLKDAQRLFGAWQPSGTGRPEVKVKPFAPKVIRCEKDIEQIHICMGVDCPPQDTPEARAYRVINTVLGGSMSSRLFQTIREERGLAYSVYSSINSTLINGVFTVYAAANPENAAQVVSLIHETIDRLGKEGVTEKEFVQAREQMLSGLIMGLESPSNRMRAAGYRMLTRGDTVTTDELIEKVNSVKLDDVNEQCRVLAQKKRSAALVGVKMDDLSDSFLQGKIS
ncbi:MAG: insulinase family protein [Clostridia bacterium]|nr:insulinase family protein [Clostridia bacterium]